MKYSILKPSEWNILFLFKFLGFWSNFKEYLNEYLLILEISTQFFDISTENRNYNVRYFDWNFGIKMFKILADIFDIST